MSPPADIIFKYFPYLSPQQQTQFSMLGSVYEEWNARVNLISRKDIESLYVRHILHSLSIAKCVQFPPQASVVDVGTGGGFPGIVLAIMFPQTHFTLIDSIGKKISAVEQIVQTLGLKNATPLQARIEDVCQKFDFAVCRAVAPLPILLAWLENKITQASFFLKGGDLVDELNSVDKYVATYDIKSWFAEDFFETKKVCVIDHTSKTTLRTRMRTLLRQMPVADMSQQSQTIVERIERHPRFYDAKSALVFAPMAGEPNIAPLVERWCGRKEFYLPVVCGDMLKIGRCCSFRELNVRNKYGILEPEPLTDMPTIDVSLVPALAFDVNGNRLGRGGGYYDRLLPQIQAYRMGVCFGLQYLPAVPHTAQDATMDEVICG
jgi:16S rRNA (guanine527-N7)-methyltransferase